MVTNTSNTAILFFTRSETVEVHSKSFGLKGDKSFQLTQALIRRTRNLLQQSPFPVFEIGVNEGLVNEGFVKALETVWNLGYDRILSVGNDCPQLKIADLIEADQLLDTHSVLAGPDLRGGVYLIGLRKEAFDQAVLLNLPWHTRHFFDYLQSNIRRLGVLTPLGDINHYQDFFRLSTQRKNLIQYFIRLLSNTRVFVLKQAKIILYDISSSLARRGPPLVR